MTVERRTTGEIVAIAQLAANEFRRQVGHPVTIAVFGLLVVIALANGLGSIKVLPAFESWMSGDIFIKVGLSQVFFNISQYCSVAALVLGLLSVAGDRRRTMGVLLTKPVLKRDVVAGKFIGLGAFMLLLIAVTYLLVSLLMALAYRGPASLEEFTLRLAALVLALFLECSLLAGIGMLIGMLFASLKEAIVVGVTYLCIEWFSNAMFMDLLKYLSPYYVYFRIINATDTITVFNTTVPFADWLRLALPYAALMVVGLIVIFIINCIVIARTEEV
ncbi:MAG: ABC-2 family transporter protein [Methanocella sp. PtaU1.Bin125]|nr:MAG: ABC-2 family transporter protein [Methanocella sp. PtaU1.Bin125]